MRDQRRPTIIVTGASGFIGRYFLQAAKEKYRIFALARRSQIECNAPRHQNIEWYMVDIGEKEELEKVIKTIGSKSEIEFILHLAGYYDFDCMKSPEYERTNVQGTRNLLELTRDLHIKRFIFASSITVCDFVKSQMPVTEKSPPNAHFPYAISKRRCEEMLQEFKDDFSCTAIRFAAVFSDWCEYEPLYALMSTWVSGKWNSRILGGKGQTAITYIHINCAVLFILRVMEHHERMKRMDILIASCSISNSHSELYELTTRLFFGKARKPIYIPKPLAALGIFIRCMFGKVLNKRPFEKMWMVNYIDRFISCNPEYSFEILPFKIRDRYHLGRRMIYLIENMKSFSEEWHARNPMISRKDTKRPNLLISNSMSMHRDAIVEHMHRFLSTSPEHPNYRSLDPDRLRWFIEFVYNLLMGSVRTSDRYSVISYYRYLALIRKKAGFSLHELKSALLKFGEIVVEDLKKVPELAGMNQYLNDQIMLTFEMAADEVDEAYSEIPDQTVIDEEVGRVALSEEMGLYEAGTVQYVLDFLTDDDHGTRFSNYRKKSQDAVGLQITLIYKLLTGCVRHNDNSSFISYIRYLASIRRKEDFPEDELIDAISKCIAVAIERVHEFSKISSVEMIIEHSIRPNIESVAREIKSVYSESVVL